MSVKTEITVNQLRDGKKERRQISLPTENPKGFYGDVTLKFEAGQVIQANVSRESLDIRR